MSGLFGKAMKFAKSKQGKDALAKVQKYAKSEEGKEKIAELKDKAEDLVHKGDKKPAAKPQPKEAPHLSPDPGVNASPAPHRDPGAPGA